jgi:hypothetical protein
MNRSPSVRMKGVCDGREGLKVGNRVVQIRDSTTTRAAQQPRAADAAGAARDLGAIVSPHTAPF